MNDIIIFTSGVILGCIISRYFIGVGNKMSINAQEGDTINAKHNPTEQSSTE
jgi:hypothetical protein